MNARVRAGRYRKGIAAVFGAVLILLALPGASQGPAGEVREEIEKELARLQDAPRPYCRREPLCGSLVLCSFYRNREYRPVWTDDRGPLPRAQSLVHAIRRADREGLRPDVYHLSRIEPLLARLEEPDKDREPPDPAVLADLDLLLTDAFLIYGSHLLAGRVHPETIHPKWDLAGREKDLGEILTAAVDKDRIEEALDAMRPSHPGYHALREALARYREILQQGGWPGVPAGPVLRPGDRDGRAAALRARLAVSGDLDPAAPAGGDPDLYDPALQQAVKRFQSRHGLASDGVVGPATIEALDVPAEERVRQLERNMERWRWLPEDLGERYVLVNTADFSLEVVEDGKRVMAMKVIAGKKARLTPVVSGRITYLVFNPSWSVPHKIAVEDILPRVKKDPGYLAREKIRVLRSWAPDAPEIAPETVDWWSYTERNFPFRLRQDPGPGNSLGRIKFIFPNKYSVYLHDTPAHHLFAQARRNFSSGCIRIEDPYALAEYLLRDDPRWTREKIVAAVESGKTRDVPLPNPVPVYLLYWTAWADSQGTVHFREDVYGRDAPLDEALRQGAEGAPATETPPADGHQVRTGPTSTCTKCGPG
jgi:L,D-transpeptidase YcbB